ncbi:MAG: cytochrome c, partial [Acidimicrobiales bacterium]|nr:cytochrome c [Acidimicrobiales bacterium]
MRSRALLLIFVALALVAAACADDGEVVDSATPTADGEQPAVGESSGDTVVAPESTAITETTAAPVGLYSSAIKPTLQANCVSCHSEGGPGSAHFDLNIAADAKNIAPQLALVTGTGYMPPWPASDLSVPFHDDRSLDPEQIAAIAEWAEAGGPLDVPDDDPLEATVAVWPQIERDAVLIAEPYKGSTDLVDDYRCQIYDPELTETSFLQNYELLPDQIPVVHHALVFHA